MEIEQVFDQVNFGKRIFYRYPPKIPWADAGEALEPFLNGDIDVDRFGIWHGTQRGSIKEQWSPEVRTAFRDQDPSSAVTWLPDSKPIRITTTTAEKIPDLQDSVDQGHFDVIHGLNACIEAMDGWIKPKDRSSRRRYTMDVTNMKRAMLQVEQAQSPTASSAVSRHFLPQTRVSPTLHVKLPACRCPALHLLWLMRRH